MRVPVITFHVIYQRAGDRNASANVIFRRFNDMNDANDDDDDSYQRRTAIAIEWICKIRPTARRLVNKCSVDIFRCGPLTRSYCQPFQA